MGIVALFYFDALKCHRNRASRPCNRLMRGSRNCFLLLFAIGAIITYFLFSNLFCLTSNEVDNLQRLLSVSRKTEASLQNQLDGAAAAQALKSLQSELNRLNAKYSSLENQMHVALESYAELLAKNSKQ